MYGDHVYGEAAPYGEAVPLPNTGHGDCVCGDGWRFELTELGGPDGGRVKAVVHPFRAEWEDAYSRTSTGSIVLAAKDVSANDLWAGATGIAISQIGPDGERVGRWHGYIEKWNGVGGGAATAAMLSIDTFLDNRLIAGPDDPYEIQSLSTGGGNYELEVNVPTSPTLTTTVAFSANITTGAAGLAAFLVRLAQGNLTGGPVVGLSELTATTDTPNTQPLPVQPGTVVYNWWDFKNIGEAIRELVEAETGIKYWREHVYNNGYWSTILHFSDAVGADRDYTILSDREAWQYGLEVNAEDKATRVYGLGVGDEGDTAFSIAYDADTEDNLPERQATVAWKDVVDATQLDALTRGYVTDHRDPVTIPSATIVGMPVYNPADANYDPQRGFPGPEILQPGDTFGVEINYGLISVKDIRVRALAIAYALDNGSTTLRTVAMQTLTRPNTSVRTQTPAKQVTPVQPVTEVVPPPKSLPWPTPGMVVNVQQTALTEISGMESSVANPGCVWVFNDEPENPQVYLVTLDTGRTRATFTPNPGVSGAPTGDPEAIRLARSTGKLVLADIGDNDNNRPTSGANQPHLLVLPEPKGSGNKGNLSATRLPIAYPGGLQVNAETLLIHPTTEQVFILTKETNNTRVYSFGALSSMNTTNNVGTLVATLTLDNTSDGTHTLDGQFVLLRATGVGPTVVYRAADWVQVGSIPTPAMKKSEAIAVESTCAFLTTTEGSHAPIYRVLIPATYGAKCNTQAGPTGGGTGGPVGPATVPSQLIDLSQWKLQLPI